MSKRWFEGLVEVSECPICGRDIEVFAWECGDPDCLDVEYSCTNCSLEHHYMHHPQNRYKNYESECAMLL